MSECVTPTHPEDILGDARWMDMHNRYVSETKISEPPVASPSTWGEPKEVTRKRTLDPSTFETPEEARENFIKRRRLQEHNLCEKLLFKNFQLMGDFFVKYYTGLRRRQCELILNRITEHLTPGALNPTQQFLVFMIKLRHNLPYTDMGYRFNVHRTTISRTFHRVLDIFYSLFEKFVFWPEREGLKAYTPPSFKTSFGDKVAIIIDCFEVFSERSGIPTELVQTWSHYKHHNTLKFLIGITPQGFVSFISKGYGGRASDTQITETCGFLENLLPGDLVLADRGFHIGTSVRIYGGDIVQPTFLKGQNQLSPWDIESTRKIANVRIHVERVIGHIRTTYTILNNKVPMYFLREVDSDGNLIMEKITRACCILINLCDKIV